MKRCRGWPGAGLSPSGWATPSTLWMKSRKFQSERDQTKYMLIEVANCRKLFQILYVYRAVTVMIEAALKVTKLILPASRMTNAGSLRRIKAGKITFSETRFCHIVGNRVYLILKYRVVQAYAQSNLQNVEFCLPPFGMFLCLVQR